MSSRFDRSGLRSYALLGVAVLLIGAAAWWMLGRGVEIAPPAPFVGDVERTPQPLSALAVPIRIPLATLVDPIEAAVPRTWGDLRNRVPIGDDARKRAAIELERGPLRGSMDGSIATVSTTIHYRLRAWYDPPILPEVSGSCATGADDLRPRLVATLRSPIGLDSTWRLRSDVRIQEVRPATTSDRDRCEITFLGIDVTGPVVDAAGDLFRRHKEEIDRLIGEVDLRSSFRSWWSILLEPVHLGDDLWLVFDPQTVQQGEVGSEGDSVIAMLSLAAYPRIVAGSRPPAIDRDLPYLEQGDVEPGLLIDVEGRIDYAAAGRRLNEELAGVELQAAGRSLRLEALELSAAAGPRLAVKATVGGDFDADLYLVGTPVYDPDSERIAVPDLAFHLSTRERLVGGAAWLADTGIESLLRRRARWPASPAVDWAAARLREGLNLRLGPDVRLEGDVSSVEIREILVASDALLVRAWAEAEASLIVEHRDEGDGRP